VSPARFHLREAAPGARLVFPEHSAHHAREVLRLRAGAGVCVFDGAGSEFEAVLEQVTRRAVTARVTRSVRPRPESPLRVLLALSPLKGDRMELAIQKATELGVTEIWPVITARTDAAARPALQGSRQERWDKVASGAAEQCGRAVVPRVISAMTLEDLLRAPFEGRRITFWETPGRPALATEPRPAAALAMVGPAGGFEGWEAEQLATAGFELVSLGPRILRAETAAIAAVTLLQVVWGDLA